MNGYTLISSIGTGMHKKEGGYRKTVYQFPDKAKKCETPLFLKAILETEYRPIKKVILVGTTSSSWDILIPDSKENSDFWFRIKDECEKNVFCDESKKELKSKLPGWYNGIKFEIVVHTNEVNQENVETVFSSYLKIPDLLEPKTGILFDITHGFRSMPLLIFQSLQLNASEIYGRKVELVYGEYIEEEKISYVRDLSKYWEYYEVSSAMKMFDDNLDGKLLAEKIKPYWESGAKCLFRLSEIVECNFSLQICEALKQIKNALADYSEAEKPQWVTDVRNRLTDIHKKINPKNGEKYPVAKTAWEYSKLLREKNLTTQAVIALQVVQETAMTEKLDKDQIGNYDWFNGDLGLSQGLTEKPRQQLSKIRKKMKMGKTLEDIEYLRNQIAHGGGKDKQGEYPHQANIPGILKPIDSAIEELFIALDEE